MRRAKMMKMLRKKRMTTLKRMRMQMPMKMLTWTMHHRYLLLQ